MKILLLALLLVSACSPQPVGPSQPTSTIQTELRAYAEAMIDGHAHAGNQLKNGVTVAKGSNIFFGYTTSAPADLVVFVQGPDGPPWEFWRGEAAGGEGDVARGGKMKALAASYEGGFTTALIAISDTPCAPTALTSAKLDQDCPGSSHSIVGLTAR